MHVIYIKYNLRNIIRVLREWKYYHFFILLNTNIIQRTLLGSKYLGTNVLEL